MITEQLLQNLSNNELLQQKDRFVKRNNELKKMNQYLSSENRDLEDKNEVFKKMAERLIKISNEIVIPKSDKDQNNFSNKFHKIFSPIKDKIKTESYVISDVLDNNARAVYRNIKKTKETFNAIKENFNEMIRGQNSKKANSGQERKKIFDKPNFKRKSFESSHDIEPQDITNKHYSVQYIEEIKFEAPPVEDKKIEGKLENSETEIIDKNQIVNEVQVDANELEKHEI